MANYEPIHGKDWHTFADLPDGRMGRARVYYLTTWQGREGWRLDAKVELVQPGESSEFVRQRVADRLGFARVESIRLEAITPASLNAAASKDGHL